MISRISEESEGGALGRAALRGIGDEVLSKSLALSVHPASVVDGSRRHQHLLESPSGGDGEKTLNACNYGVLGQVDGSRNSLDQFSDTEPWLNLTLAQRASFDWSASGGNDVNTMGEGRKI